MSTTSRCLSRPRCNLWGEGTSTTRTTRTNSTLVLVPNIPGCFSVSWCVWNARPPRTTVAACTNPGSCPPNRSMCRVGAAACGPMHARKSATSRDVPRVLLPCCHGSGWRPAQRLVLDIIGEPPQLVHAGSGQPSDECFSPADVVSSFQLCGEFVRTPASIFCKSVAASTAFLM